MRSDSMSPQIRDRMIREIDDFENEIMQKKANRRK